MLLILEDFTAEKEVSSCLHFLRCHFIKSHHPDCLRIVGACKQNYCLLYMTFTILDLG